MLRCRHKNHPPPFVSDARERAAWQPLETPRARHAAHPHDDARGAPAPRARVFARTRLARVVAPRAASASAAGAAGAATTSRRSARAARPRSRARVRSRRCATRRRTRTSPPACATRARTRRRRGARGWLCSQGSSRHRANASRTKAHLGLRGAEAAAFDASYLAWEADYEAYLESVSRDEDEDVARDAGATLLDMVDEKERLLRARGLDDLFAGMKAQENAVAAALFPALANEIDAIWNAADHETIFPSVTGSDELDPVRVKADETKKRAGERWPSREDVAARRVAAARTALECCLAGNLFDAGAAAAVQGVADAAAVADDESCGSILDAARLAETFAEARRRVARDANEDAGTSGWRFDSFDAVASRARKKPWRRVVVFCDNAGADVMGMALLARTLVELGGLRDTKVALAANEWAALNDVTARETRAFLETVVQSPASSCEELDEELLRDGAEPPFSGDETLRRQIERGAVTAVSSGQMSTLLDLNRCGPELNDWVEAELRAVPAGEEWLVVFDGMGRSLESNWDVAGAMAPGVNTLNLAMVKSQINAERLGAAVYDCVVKLSVGGLSERLD